MEPKHPYRASGAMWSKLKPLAREMRHEPTPAELRLWQHIRNRKIAGAKFRRQHGIERFIVDFYAAREWLVVEVDGDYHQYTAEEDKIRQAYLESLGLTMVRVSNDNVMGNLEGVLAWIAQAVINGRAMQAAP